MPTPNLERAKIPRPITHKARGSWADAFSHLLKNRMAIVGLIIILAMALAALFAPWVAPKHYSDGDLLNNYAPPSSQFLLGADFLETDVLSRIIYGVRISLTVGVVGATVASIIGIIYGSISGYYGGRLDNWMMRLVDLMYGIPRLLIIILLMVYFRASSAAAGDQNLFISLFRNIDNAIGGMFFIFIGIALTSWMTIARLVRGIVLSLKEREFIEASRAAGGSDLWIMSRHLLPNFLGPVIVAETLNIPQYILIEAFLSFIGLGVNPPMPSWGGMISEGIRSMRSNPHLVLFPAAALSLSLLAFNFLGDGLRDALDPRMK